MNSLYTQFLHTLGNPAHGIDLSTSDFKVALVDSAVYTPDIDTDSFLSQIASTIAISDALANQQWVDATFIADSIVIPAVSGAEFEYAIVFHDTGNPATSELIALFDSSDDLPTTPNDGDITIVWGTHIFKL